MNSLRTTSRRLVLCALLAAVMTVLQLALAPLPNIEPVSLLVLVYALVFGRDVFYIVFTFILLEGLVFGFHLWWMSYLYIWPLWAGLVLLLRRGKAPTAVGGGQRDLRAELRGAVRPALFGRRALGRPVLLGGGHPL